MAASPTACVQAVAAARKHWLRRWPGPSVSIRPWLGVLAALRSHSGAGCSGPVSVTVQVQRGVHWPQSSVRVTELTGMTSKNGKPYMAKLAEVQAVLRDTLKQRLQAAYAQGSGAHPQQSRQAARLDASDAESCMSEGRGIVDLPPEQIRPVRTVCALCEL